MCGNTMTFAPNPWDKKKWNTKAMYPKNVGACAVLLQTDLTSHIITSYSRPT